MKKPQEEAVYRAVLVGELEIDAEGRIWRVRKRGWDRWKHCVVSRVCTKVRAENDSGDYLQVSVMYNGKDYATGAHRLVYRHFKGPIPVGLTVNHQDGDKKRNHPANLELATYSDQQIHATRVLKVGHACNQYGTRNSMAKLSDEAILQIRERYALGGVTQTKLAKVYGVVFQTISDIVRGGARKLAPGPTADYASRRNNPLRSRNALGQFH